MIIYIEDRAKEAIERHAEGDYPNEVCGILLGKDADGQRIISNAIPIDNSFESGEQHHRFRITPEAMFAAEKLARCDQMDVLGVYHSHPDTPARPSEYDRNHAAWTSWTYIIVSIQGGTATDMRAWHLNEARSAFSEVHLLADQALSNR